jgi:hypothetical protein
MLGCDALFFAKYKINAPRLSWSVVQQETKERNGRLLAIVQKVFRVSQT